MKKKIVPSWMSGAIILVALLGGLGYIGFNVIERSWQDHGGKPWPYVLLGVALLIALGFEFVNGFHDTANAVATVIYTHSLEPNIAVVWSGLCNLAGVLLSSGAVAFAVITLLPVELILQGELRRGIRDGVRAADRGDPLEPGHMVVRAAGVELAHDGRVDHRRGTGEPTDECAPRHVGRGLGAGDQGFEGAADFADLSDLRWPQRCCSCSKRLIRVSGALRSAQRQGAATVADSRAAGADLHAA